MNIFRSIALLFVLFIISIYGFGQTYESLKADLLNRIDKSQINFSPDHADAVYNGLWWSEIYNARYSPLFGSKGKKDRDANCFITALIHNVLAEIYEDDSTLTMIPAMLEKARPALKRFRNGDGFHYFPSIEGVRRASHFKYPRFTIRHVFNIYNDTDDTSVASYAMYLGQNGHSQEAGMELLDQLKPYRDIKGSGLNFWNFFTGISKQTGAFETWMPEDTSRVLFNIIPRLGHPYIPLGVNDVDCVVNANILGSLAGMGVVDTPEVRQVSKWLIQIVEQKKCRQCANYYPTSNTLAYAVGEALKRGACVLQPAAPLLVEALLNAQKDDGSWPDRIPGNSIQATLFAVNALICLSEFTDQLCSDQISKGITFLANSYYDDCVFWKTSGGAAGSAGFWFKRDHLWLSLAWSQTLLLEILCNYDS